MSQAPPSASAVRCAPVWTEGFSTARELGVGVCVCVCVCENE